MVNAVHVLVAEGEPTTAQLLIEHVERLPGFEATGQASTVPAAPAGRRQGAPDDQLYSQSDRHSSRWLTEPAPLPGHLF